MGTGKSVNGQLGAWRTISGGYYTRKINIFCCTLCFMDSPVSVPIFAS